jgi:hypothetical protein
MIDLLSTPAAIEAPAAVSGDAWYPMFAASGAGKGGAVFGCTVEHNEIPTRASPGFANPLVRRLQQYLRLEQGWNSYDAPPVSQRAVQTALAHLAQMAGRPRPSLVPTSQGGIQLEWHGAQVDIEVECLPSGHARLVAEDCRTEEYVECWVIPGHIEIENWLDRLHVALKKPVQ